MDTRQCRKCGNGFTPESHRQYYCSTECSPWKTRLRKTCLICGVAVPSAHKYCPAHKDRIKQPKVYYAAAHRRAAVNWQKNHPEKAKAQYLSQYYPERLNVLYECRCEGDKENHHPDYSKPYDVIRLCGPCHKQEHARLRSADLQEAV